MVTSVRKGKKINEEEIPPPVALGKSVSSQQSSSPGTTPLLQPSIPDGSSSLLSHSSLQPPATTPPQLPQATSPKMLPPVLPKPKVLPVPALLIGSPEILEEKSVPLAPSPQAGRNRRSLCSFTLQGREGWAWGYHRNRTEVALEGTSTAYI